MFVCGIGVELVNLEANYPNCHSIHQVDVRVQNSQKITNKGLFTSCI